MTNSTEELLFFIRIFSSQKSVLSQNILDTRHTDGSKIIRAFEINRVKKLIFNAVL